MEFPELGTHCAVQSCSRLGMAISSVHASPLCIKCSCLHLSVQIFYHLNVMHATRYSGELSSTPVHPSIAQLVERWTVEGSGYP